jgi:hypothetical protein
MTTKQGKSFSSSGGSFSPSSSFSFSFFVMLDSSYSLDNNRVSDVRKDMRHREKDEKDRDNHLTNGRTCSYIVNVLLILRRREKERPVKRFVGLLLCPLQVSCHSSPPLFSLILFSLYHPLKMTRLFFLERNRLLSYYFISLFSIESHFRSEGQ